MNRGTTSFTPVPSSTIPVLADTFGLSTIVFASNLFKNKKSLVSVLKKYEPCLDSFGDASTWTSVGHLPGCIYCDDEDNAADDGEGIHCDADDEDNGEVSMIFRSLT